MRIFLLTAILFLKFTSFSQEIQFESKTYNFETIDYDAPSNFKIKFTNIGDKPLIISRASGSSGCIMATWPKEPIAPNESNFITVKYDTRRVGRMIKTISVLSNCIQEPNLVLTVKGTVRPFAELHIQDPIKNYEHIQAGSVLKETVTITNNYQFPLTMLRIHGADSNFLVSLNKKMLSPDESLSLELTIDTKKLNGKIEKIISISSKEIENSTKIKCSMNVFSSPLQFDEEDLLVNHSKGDSSLSQYRFNFTNASSDFVRISSITEIIINKWDAKEEVTIEGDFPTAFLSPGEKGKLTFSISRDKKHAYFSDYERIIYVNLELKSALTPEIRTTRTHVLKCKVKQDW